MGVVLLAVREGPGFEQTVALKLMRGSLADPRLAQRLEGERRILARLEHPGIARLIDGGVTPEGQPFFAMEFVEGRQLLDHCQQEELSLDDRLRLFVDICDAVHFAHQQLVVHRDLKPSNILVTPEGRAKLLDFGIAKCLQGESPGEATMPWITPAYASPEQASGRAVSTLSDVYSLGILLCELLTGSRPYDTTADSPAELSRIISEEPARRPSDLVSGEPTGESTTTDVAGLSEPARQRLARALRGDLDLIVLKALAKEPDRRYDSVRALADDVRRYLQGQPIQARPDSAVYRTRMFLRRHRIKVTAAAVVFLAVIGGAGVAAWQAQRATAQRDRAELESSRSRQVASLLTEIFRLGDPDLALGDTIGVRRVLEEGVARVRQGLGGDGELQATLLLELARIYRNLGIFDQALELGAQAVDLRAAIAAGTLEHADALGFLGVTLRAAGQATESMAYLERAIALRNDLGIAPDTVLAEMMTELGWEVRVAGDLPRAATLFADALAIQRTMRGPSHPTVATNMVGLAAAYHDQGSFDQAEELFRGALDLGASTRPNPVAATALLNLGMVRKFREQFQEAERLLRTSTEMRMALFGAGHPAVIEAEHQLGSCLVSLGRFAEADRVLRRALRDAVATLGEDHMLTRGSREGLASVDWELGRYTVALARLDSVLAAKVRANGPDHSGNVFSLVLLGDLALEVGNLTRAESHYRAALDMRARLAEPPGVYDLLARHGQARVALARGNLPLADSLVTNVLASTELRPGHRYRLEMQRTQAQLLLAQGRASQARTLLEEVMGHEEQVRPSPHPRRGQTLALLGRAHLALGDSAAAEAALQRALTEYSGLPPDHGHLQRARAWHTAAAGTESSGPPA